VARRELIEEAAVARALHLPWLEREHAFPFAAHSLQMQVRSRACAAAAQVAHAASRMPRRFRRVQRLRFARPATIAA